MTRSRAPRYGPAFRAGQRDLPPTSAQLLALDLLSRGRTVREVAEALGVSVNTAKTHVARLYARLGAVNAAHAVRLGTERGLLTDDAPARCVVVAEADLDDEADDLGGER